MEESDTILKLRQQLRDVEEECMKAGQYGVQLLENVTELQNHLEEQRIEMTSTIETLEQEKYTLQREVELKQRMLESLGSEYEHFKQQQKMNQENLKEQLERNFEHETRILKDQWEKLKSDLDEARLNEKQLKHKLNYQSELLANKSEELRMLSEHAHETMSSEMIDLQHQIQDLETAKAILEEELNELQYKQEQLERSNSNQSRQLDRIQTEKEEREKEVVSYLRALEKAREANQELQVQLDQALQQAQDPTSKGNSLFSEVEDRRAEMERALISVKVQHQSLQKQHAFTRQQLHRMKVQIATLLQSKGYQTDPEQLERLQAMLAQKNGEIERLLIKVRQLEKYQNQEPETTSNVKTAEGGNGDETYYVDLLKMKLENLNKEIETIKDELSLQRMKALAESQRVLELERKLFTNERNHKLCQSENMKLRIGLDELKMKYEPDEITKLRTLKRKQEILPLDIASSEGIGNHGISMQETCNKLSEKFEVNDLLLKSLEEKGTAQSVVETGSGECYGNLLIPKEETQIPEMPPKERKRVRIMVDENDAEALNENNGCENTKTSMLSRSVTASIGPQGIEQRPTSIFFRCMSCAIRLFLFFLSFACHAVPQIRVPKLTFPLPFKRKT